MLKHPFTHWLIGIIIFLIISIVGIYQILIWFVSTYNTQIIVWFGVAVVTAILGEVGHLSFKVNTNNISQVKSQVNEMQYLAKIATIISFAILLLFLPLILILIEQKTNLNFKSTFGAIYAGFISSFGLVGSIVVRVFLFVLNFGLKRIEQEAQMKLKDSGS